MSRRAYQVLRTSLRAVHGPSIRPQVVQRVPIVSRRVFNRINFIRCYATESPGGAPPPTENKLTPEEQERNELHTQAGEFVKENKLEKALEIYNTLLSRSDLSRLERRLTFFNLGVIHHRKGDLEKGIKYWEDVISMPMTTTDALVEAEEIELAAAANMNLGAHFVLNKQLEKGLGYLQSAAELDPDDGEIRYNLAAALTAGGKHGEAIREFEASAERGVDMAKEIIRKLREGLAENEKKTKDDEDAEK